MRTMTDHASRLIHDAKKAPKLSREEERELLLSWQTRRDQTSAQRLVAANMRHVVFTALRFKRYGVAVDELISEGNIGLMRALDKFNPEHGTRFATYACYWIRSYVVACALKSRTIVGSGTGVFSSRTFFRLKRARARARSLYGESPEATRLVCESMGVTETQLHEMEARLDASDASLDAPMQGDDGATLVECLSAEGSALDDYSNTQQLDSLSDALRTAVSKLKEREKFIVKHRLMAHSDDELSLSELGRHFGISRERVRQLEERAKEKLRLHVERAHRKVRRPHELNVAFA